MNTFLKRIGLFCLLSLIVYPLMIACYSFIGNPFIPSNVRNQLGAYGHLHTRLSEASTIKDIDVLALGSSLCYRGFDPRIFKKQGINLFNLGSSGQTHVQTQILLKSYMNQFNPDLVIYECNPSIFLDDGVGSGLDLIYNSDLNADHLNMALILNNMKLYNNLLNSSIRKFLNLDEHFKEDTLKGEDTYIAGGFVEKNLAFFKHTTIDETTKTIFNPLPRQLNAFKTNIELIKQSGAELLLVSAPVTKFQYSSCSYIESSDSLFQTFGRYINFNKLIKLDDSLHFYDKTHLNQNGVEIFNEIVINKLQYSLTK